MYNDARLASPKLLWLGLAIGAAVCGCGKDSVGNDDNGDNDGGDADNVGPRVLAYSGTSPLPVAYGATETLSFVVTDAETATAVTGAEIELELSANGGTLSADTITTDHGFATVDFTAGNADAQLTLTATTAGAPDPVVVELYVLANPYGDLALSVTSAARIPIAKADISVYVVGPTAAVRTCQSLTGATQLPTAQATFSLTTVPGAHTFTQLLATGKATALVRGYNATNDLVAQGCKEGVVVAGGAPTNASVELAQLPSTLAGKYDVMMSIQLASSLPEPFGSYVLTTVAVLNDPAGAIVYFILDAVAPSMLNWVPPEGGDSRKATLGEVLMYGEISSSFSLWKALKVIALDMIDDLPMYPTYQRVQQIAGDVNTMIRSLDLGIRLELTAAADAADQYDVVEKWNAAAVTWSRDCTAGDAGCSRRLVDFSNNGAPVSSTYRASAARTPSGAETERFTLTPQSHSMAFNYGRAILTVLDQLVYPSLCTGCTNLADVLKSIINCTEFGQWVAAKLQAEIPGLPANIADLAKGGCETGLAWLAGYAEQQVATLTVNTPFLATNTVGTNGGTMSFDDADHDLRGDVVSAVQLSMRWKNPDGSVAAAPPVPLTGHGRAAATACASDAACSAANESCQPVPHYLEVKAIETTCKKAVGATAASQTCTRDDQCRSGLCVLPGTGQSGKCFAACAQATDCTSNVCDPNRTTIDLDVVRAGLGDVPARGCNP